MALVKEVPWLSFLTFYMILATTSTLSYKTSHVHHFEAPTLRTDETVKQVQSRESEIRRKRGAEQGVQTCVAQETKFLQDVRIGSKRLEQKFAFENETNHGMGLAWAGENDGTLIVVTTEEMMGYAVKKSHIYRSSDFGANWTLIDDKVPATIKKNHGLQRNPHEAQKVYLLGLGDPGTMLYITDDGGLNFTPIQLKFSIDGPIIFHPQKQHAHYLMVTSAETKTVYVSINNGKDWNSVISYVQMARWGTSDGDSPLTIYATVDSKQRHPFLASLFVMAYDLKKSVNGGQTWTTILEDVISFGHEGKFLYASVLEDNNEMQGSRVMKLSTDGGKTWNAAQLPTITSDRFYSVLDMDEGMVFLHVDNPGDTGHGTLYVSAGKGIIYSESLQKHLYPNFGDVTDFYKVESMRGVYLASQMNDDNSIHTMITFNHGATWQKIKKPEGATCKDEAKECNLQIHGTYSITRGVTAQTPLSAETAVGIALVHGHVADALQTTPPDVFITSDGGYNWRLALKGPHHYHIGDSGGLLVAVPAEQYPKTIKFSTDEGNCWHHYNFTNETIAFTGLLTEPGSKSMSVSIWGYRHTDQKWTVFVIDFKQVIQKQCVASDYTTWIAHQDHRKEEGVDIAGCLLGQKEEFQRLKQDSWCYNGFEHFPEKKGTVCTCTREDYECEYGYYRPADSELCLEIPEFRGPEIDICVRGHEEKIITKGYRKIPGDKCQNGFSPSGELQDLDKTCKEKSKELVIEEIHPPPPVTNNGGKVVLGLVVAVATLVIIVMVIYFTWKLLLLRRHKVVYKYSMLNQNDHEGDLDLENALTSPSVMYADSSDDEEVNSSSPSHTAKSREVERQSRQKREREQPKPEQTFNPFHDDSDDDMLA